MSKEFDNLKQQVEDLQDIVNELGDNVSDLSDTAGSQQDTLDEMEERTGKLDFPLDQETVDLIKEIFPADITPNMVAGEITVDDLRISDNSVIIYSRKEAAGTLGHLSISAQSTGSVTFHSTSATETSTIYYVIY